MMAYYVHHLSPFIVEFRPGIGIRWYRLAYVLAFVCGYWLYKRLAKLGYSQLAPEKVGDFITWAALAGVMVGGRLGYILFYTPREALHDPLIIFKVWEGGMSSHGGILGLVLFTYYHARRHYLSWPGLGDNLVVVAPLGIFFGRCANFINGELYGRATQVAWAMQFPGELYDSPELSDRARIALQIDGLDTMIAQAHADPRTREVLAGILTPRHPSQIYEAALEGVVLFCLLLFLRLKTRQPRGVITGAFFILYAILRIIGEFFRQPDAWHIGWLTAGQFLSLFLVLIGVAFVVYGKTHPEFERAQS
jgi:phosphatidylglycerol:prolipoprotein diacylglycerol transferase